MRLILLVLLTAQMMFGSHRASSAPPQQGKCDYCGTVVGATDIDRPSERAQQLDQELRTKGRHRAQNCNDLVEMEKANPGGYRAGGGMYSSDYYICNQRDAFTEYKVSFNAGNRTFRSTEVGGRFKVGDKVALVDGLLVMQEELKTAKPKAAAQKDIAPAVKKGTQMAHKPLWPNEHCGSVRFGLPPDYVENGLDLKGKIQFNSRRGGPVTTQDIHQFGPDGKQYRYAAVFGGCDPYMLHQIKSIERIDTKPPGRNQPYQIILKNGRSYIDESGAILCVYTSITVNYCKSLLNWNTGSEVIEGAGEPANIDLYFRYVVRDPASQQNQNRHLLFDSIKRLDIY